MNILLTGASGFLGRNFILQAPRDWHILALFHNDGAFPEFVERAQNPNLSSARCDLTNGEEVARVFREHGREFDSCLYLAAKVDIPWSVRDPKGDLVSNTESLLNVLENLRTRKLVYFSSGAVYDGMNGEVHPRLNPAPSLPYAISKLASERYVEFYSRRRKSIDQYLIVRFFGAYGPYEAEHKIYSRLIRAFAFERKDSYTIYGGGQNLIDAMYVDDAVDALCRLLQGDHWNDTVNLACGQPQTIEALVREVGHALGIREVRIEKEGVAHEANRFWGSTSEMREYFGFEPKVNLADGIRRFRDFLAADGKSRQIDPHP
jgi:nucleoside-diphosphate-sugar epimerase